MEHKDFIALLTEKVGKVRDVLAEGDFDEVGTPAEGDAETYAEWTGLLDEVFDKVSDFAKRRGLDGLW